MFGSRPVVSVLTAAVVLAGAVAGPFTASSAEAAPPPLQPLPEADPASIDDGYGHFVVAVPASELQSHAEAPGADGAASDSTPTDRPQLDIARLSALGDTVDRIDVDGHVVYAVLDDGSRVRVDRGAALEDDIATTNGGGGAASSAAGDGDVPATISRLSAAGAIVDAAPASGVHWSVRTELDADAFRAAAADAGAVSVSDDPVFESYSDDPYAPWLWGLENTGGRTYGGVVGVDDVDVDGVEARAEVTGAGVVVAVIDSGVQPDHQDLAPLWRNAGEANCTNGVDDDANGYVDDCRGWDFHNRDNTPYDPGTGNDHGTHITSTIASRVDNGVGTAGLSPGVTVMNLKVLQYGSMWMSNGSAAIRYAVDNGADIINASWGSAAGTTRAQVASLEDAIDYAHANGVIVVAAAGNQSKDIDVEPHWPASFPQDNVVTVGALQADDAPASFSNHGTIGVDLYAPGHYIVAAVDGNRYGAMQGTSMAAPHVTAAGALVLAENPGAGVADVRSALLSTVVPVPALAPLAGTGGRLNAAAAIGLGDATDALQVVLTGADRFAPDTPTTLTAAVTLADPSVAGDRDVEIRATVLTAVDGEAYAVTGLPVTVDGVESLTDERASVAVTPGGPAGDLASTVTVDLGLELPAGVYVLAFEVVDASDAGTAYGPAATVFLTAGADAPVASPTTQPDATSPTTQPGGSTPPPTQPGGSTPTTQPAATTPTSQPGGTTPTTQPGGSTPSPTTPPGRSAPTTQPGGSTPSPTTQPGGTSPTTLPGGSTPTPTQPRGSTAPPATQPGGVSPTTQPSATSPTAPRGTTPTPTTQPAGTTPDVVAPEPVSNDGMSITSVAPRSGPTAGGTLVTVSGSGFGEHVRVLFGHRAGAMLFRTSTRLVVRTPAMAAGTVDVTVADHVGNDVTMPRAFTFLDGDGTTPPGGPTPTTTAPTSPTTAPATSPTTAPAPGSDPTAGPTTTASEGPSTARPRLVAFGAPVTRSGLTLVKVASSPVAAAPSTWAALACRSATCTATSNR